MKTRRLKDYKYFFILILFPFIASAAGPGNRVEELFIWKISDEMKLSVPEEKSFSELIRNINKKKAGLNENLQENLKSMATAKTKADKEKLLHQHRGLLKDYNALSLEEIERVQKIFGIERTAQYLVLKNDLSQKLKSVLATPEKPAAAPMAPPRIIEEK